MKLKQNNSEKSELAASKSTSKESLKVANASVPDIRMVAVARTQDTDDWHTVFQFRRHDGLTAYMALPSGDAVQEKTLATALRNAGASGSSHFTFNGVVKALTTATGRSDGMIVIRGGWDELNECFALPDRMLVNEKRTNSAAAKFICLNFNWKKKFQLVVKDGSPGVSQLEIGCHGSAESWKKRVAAPALKSSFMMSGICAAFAAPMLKLLGVAPFTIVLTGETTSGKTTVTSASASVVGFGKADQLPTWILTEAGLEERAEIHFDMLLPIDDLNSAPVADKKKFGLVTGVAYRITGGSKKHTLSSAKSGMTGRPPVKGAIRTIILTSAEDSMADIAAAADMTLPGGFFSRLIEMPVPKPKRGGVFDLARFEGSRVKRVKAARKLAKAIASACKNNHGTVFREYIEATIKDPERAERIVRSARDEFMKIVGIDRKEALQWRRAEIFSLLFGAGAYAIELKLLPWTLSQLREGLLKCFAASWKTLPDSSNLLGAGLARLRKHLLRADRIVAASAVKDLESIDGWWEIVGGNKTYMLFGDRFRGWFSSSAQRRRVETFLEKKVVLIPTANGEPTKQPVLPRTGKKAPRCYELRVPADGSPSALFPARLPKVKGPRPKSKLRGASGGRFGASVKRKPATGTSTAKSTSGGK